MNAQNVGRPARVAVALAALAAAAAIWHYRGAGPSTTRPATRPATQPAAMAWGSVVFVAKARAVEPAFRLPKAKKVLVFADDSQAPLKPAWAARVLMETVNRRLQAAGAVAGTVSHDALKRLAAGDAKFDKYAVATVGRKLGADLVVYIILDPLQLKDAPTDSLWHGRFGGRVRVVDVSKGRIWPEAPEGEQVVVTDPARENAAKGFGEKLARKLAEDLGDEIGTLFTGGMKEGLGAPATGPAK